MEHHVPGGATCSKCFANDDEPGVFTKGKRMGM